MQHKRAEKTKKEQTPGGGILYSKTKKNNKKTRKDKKLFCRRSPYICEFRSRHKEKREVRKDEMQTLLWLLFKTRSSNKTYRENGSTEDSHSQASRPRYFTALSHFGAVQNRKPYQSFSHSVSHSIVHSIRLGAAYWQNFPPFLFMSARNPFNIWGSPAE